MLAIEDLHWADRSTRDLLRFLAANLRGERLAILATYRADDLHRGHPLRTLLAELERGGWAERLRLRPFTRAEVAEQISAILGEPPAPAFVSEVFERTEGNAFCVEQLVATAREGRGSQLPTLLQDILHARFERLSPARAAAARRGRRRRTARARGADRRRRADGEPTPAARRRRPSDPRRRGRRLRVPPRAAPRGRLWRAAARRAPPRARRLRRGAGRRRDRRRTPSWRATGTRPDELAPALAASVRPRRTPNDARLRGGERPLRPRTRGMAAREPRNSAGTSLSRCSAAPPRPPTSPARARRAATLIRAALEETDSDLVPEVAGELHQRLGRYLWAAGDSEAATVAYEEAVRPRPPSRRRPPAPESWAAGPGADAVRALRRVAGQV